ncbi:transporter [Thalassobium sp. R2A62]|uniref:transporter n=1 Tax=Thalassobium sp. R2A62 TaxID=633131 RepID=UPI001CC06874|nr:transporter [Thalassobium sp. R2A62]
MSNTQNFQLLELARRLVESTGITALARYKLNDNFSIHGGARVVSANGEYSTAGGAYESVYSSGSAAGYVLGAAYEIPDIALWVAVTYSSAMDFELDGSNGDFSANLPESINLDFQTGIAADTLLFGSIRYVAWDGVTLTDSDEGDLVAYTDDVITYNIDVGRRLSEQLAVSASIGHEKSTGELTGNLGPTDGFTSLSIGAAYTMDTGVELSGGVRFVRVGDATTRAGFEFADNSVVGVGFKVGYNF